MIVRQSKNRVAFLPMRVLYLVMAMSRMIGEDAYRRATRHVALYQHFRQTYGGGKR